MPTLDMHVLLLQFPSGEIASAWQQTYLPKLSQVCGLVPLPTPALRVKNVLVIPVRSQARTPGHLFEPTALPEQEKIRAKQLRRNVSHGQIAKELQERHYNGKWIYLK